jgi:hypothetical protein
MNAFSLLLHAAVCMTRYCLARNQASNSRSQWASMHEAGRSAHLVVAADWARKVAAGWWGIRASRTLLLDAPCRRKWRGGAAHALNDHSHDLFQFAASRLHVASCTPHFNCIRHLTWLQSVFWRKSKEDYGTILRLYLHTHPSPLYSLSSAYRARLPVSCLRVFPPASSDFPSPVSSDYQVH